MQQVIIIKFMKDFHWKLIVDRQYPVMARLAGVTQERSFNIIWLAI